MGYPVGFPTGYKRGPWDTRWVYREISQANPIRPSMGYHGWGIPRAHMHGSYPIYTWVISQRDIGSWKTPRDVSQRDIGSWDTPWDISQRDIESWDAPWDSHGKPARSLGISHGEHDIVILHGYPRSCHEKQRGILTSTNPWKIPTRHDIHTYVRTYSCLLSE